MSTNYVTIMWSDYYYCIILWPVFESSRNQTDQASNQRTDHHRHRRRRRRHHHTLLWWSNTHTAMHSVSGKREYALELNATDSVGDDDGGGGGIEWLACVIWLMRNMETHSEGGTFRIRAHKMFCMLTKKKEENTQPTLNSRLWININISGRYEWCLYGWIRIWMNIYTTTNWFGHTIIIVLFVSSTYRWWRSSSYNNKWSYFRYTI